MADRVDRAHHKNRTPFFGMIELELGSDVSYKANYTPSQQPCLYPQFGQRSSLPPATNSRITAPQRSQVVNPAGIFSALMA